jgi:hypothetical protein
VRPAARILVPVSAFVIAASVLMAGAAAARLTTSGDHHCRRDGRDCKHDPAATTTGHTTTLQTTTATETQGKTNTAAGLVGSITLVDKPFVCTSLVHLTSVTVTIRNVSSDAVLLRKGCTGSIGKLTVVQYHGDGIKVGDAHNLVIDGGSVRCYGHDAGKHQDGVQVLGGDDVTFVGLDVGCYSANNSQVWINDGTGSGPGGIPTNVLFQGGHFQGYFNHGQYGPGGAYGVAIVDSLDSGIVNATICPNAHPAHALYIAGSAKGPVTSGTKVVGSC